MNTVVAVPSAMPGGLQASIGAHFGHCDLYTLVSIADGKINQIDVIPNVPHQQGGCTAPVQYLAAKGAHALIAGGMGLRPLMGFQQVGIRVFYGGNAATVGNAVEAFVHGRLPQFDQQHTCGGGAHRVG